LVPTAGFENVGLDVGKKESERKNGKEGERKGMAREKEID